VQFVSFDWFPLVEVVRALTSDRVGKWRLNHPMINMIVEVEILIIARVQATVKPLDLPRVLPRPETSIQNGNMLKIRAILSSPKSVRRTGRI